MDKDQLQRLLKRAKNSDPVDVPEDPRQMDGQDYLDPEVIEDLARSASNSGANSGRRLEAALAYITDPDGLTIDQILSMEGMQDIPKPTLSAWASKDKWTARRKAFLSALTKKFQKKMGDELTQARLQEFRNMQRLRSLAMEKLEDPETLPKSWEGVLKAFLDLSRRSEELYVDVTSSLDPTGQGQAESPTVLSKAAEQGLPSEMTEAQLDYVAKQIMQSERKMLRDALGGEVSGPEPVVKKKEPKTFEVIDSDTGKPV